MVRLLVAVLAASAIVGCTPTPPESAMLTVLASSELTDLAPILEKLRNDTGVELKLDLKGTVQASNELTKGDTGYDLAWLSSDRYLNLKSANLPLSTSTMLSPLVVGVKPDKAKQLRENRSSWADIAARAGAGELTFGMSDPRVSGSGLAALIGVATAAAGTGAALKPEDVTCDKLQGFLVGRRTIGASNAAELVDEYVRKQDDIDAVITYESTVLSMNASGMLRQPLEVIYPRDGIMLSDYPLMLLKPDKRAVYDRVVEWLRSESAQRAIMERTFRRPVDPDTPRTDELTEPLSAALYFPSTQQVVDTLLTAYDRAGKGSKVAFALDFSTSMKDARIAELREAFTTLTGNGGFDQFHVGETITVVRFAGQVLDERTVTIDGRTDLDALRDVVASGSLGRGTAIWSALDHAYRLVGDGTVVLMTDGESNAGMSKDAFLAAWPTLPAPTYVIRLGDADPAQLANVIGVTGVVAVDATTGSLLEAVKKIRGCR